MKLRGKAVVIALLLVGATAIPAAATGYGTGWDISSCVSTHPDGAIALLPLNQGLGYTTNSCLGSEIATAAAQGKRYDIFVNGADPGPSSPHWPACGNTSAACAGTYGSALAADEISRATGVVTTPTFFWIDVESLNSWQPTGSDATDVPDNIAVLKNMISTLTNSPGIVSGVGIYSNKADPTTNWPKITGSDMADFKGFPLWSSSPTASQLTAQQNCSPQASFAGGPVVLTQFARPDSTDGDVICPPVVTASTPKAGAHYTIKGTGFPGSAVSVVVRETDRTDLPKSAIVSATGIWSITATARYNASVTASTMALGISSPLGTVKVTPVLVKPKFSAGACSVTVTGAIAPYAAGEGVSLSTKGHGSVALAVKKAKSGNGVITKKTVHEPCGTKVLVAITTSGKARGKTYSQPLTTATAKWTTLRTRA